MAGTDEIYHWTHGEADSPVLLCLHGIGSCADAFFPQRDLAEMNDINAQLAAQGQRAARTALGILTGRPSGDDTYADLRRKPAAAARQILGKV